VAAAGYVVLVGLVVVVNIIGIELSQVP
jgi:hypothetical protein